VIDDRDFPERQIALRGMTAGAGAKVTLLGTGEPLPFRASGSQLMVEVQPELRFKMPERNLYTLKLTGVKAV